MYNHDVIKALFCMFSFDKCKMFRFCEFFFILCPILVGNPDQFHILKLTFSCVSLMAYSILYYPHSELWFF